ncbi:MAG: HAMP domain-containing protein, partial [Proteobacteria bacterium]|nr:HAMP domain-containing protein [Pseudomonadota bacterium]
MMTSNELSAEDTDIIEDGKQTDAQTDDGGSQPAPKLKRSLGVGAKIGSVVAICMIALVAVSGISITQMQKINTEIEGIAERDIPLTEIVTKITVHQLEQAINFERSVRYGEEMHTHASARPHFEESVHKFEKLSAKVNEELKKGEEMAQHAIDTAHSAEEKKEFTHVLEAMKTIEIHHAGYDKHAVEALQLLQSADTTTAAIKLFEKIEKEEEKLDQELKALLGEIETFTRQAALTAEEHEKFAVKLLMIVSAAAILLAVVFAWLLVSRTISRPLRDVIGSVTALQAGDLDVEIKAHSGDEIGAVATALVGFRENMKESKRLEAEAAERDLRLAEAEKQREIDQREAAQKAEAAKREADENAAAQRRSELLELAET